MLQRLNNLMVLHVYKERTSDLVEVDICNDLMQTHNWFKSYWQIFVNLSRTFQFFLQIKYHIPTVEKVVY